MKKKKPLNRLYGDFIYDKSLMKLSQDDLADATNISLREAFSYMESLKAKTYFLVKNGEASRSELRKLHQFADKLEQMINDFKYGFLK